MDRLDQIHSKKIYSHRILLQKTCKKKLYICQMPKMQYSYYLLH